MTPIATGGVFIAMCECHTTDAVCVQVVVRIVPGMPQLWRDSVEAHRNAVQEAALDAVQSLIAEGSAELTMSGLAARAGVARATLYK